MSSPGGAAVAVIGDTSRDASDAVAALGVKGAALSLLAANNIPTPPGFVVATSTFERAIDASHARRGLQAIWDAAAGAAPAEVARLSRKARHLIRQTDLIAADAADLEHALDRLGRRRPLAVRSSPTADAVSGPVCAGVHASYLGVVGGHDVEARVRSCWASLFSERALLMRGRGLGSGWPTMAVVVHAMVDADASGFVTPHGDDELLIEATFGLGEPIVTGAVDPDRYLLRRLDATPHAVEIGSKRIVLASAPNGGHRFSDPDDRDRRVLDDAQIDRLRALSALVERIFGVPQEIEFAFEGTALWVLQARDAAPTGRPVGDVELSGVGVGLGSATGAVRVVHRLDQLVELCDGEVLVAATTEPEWNPHLARASAVVTDEGDEHGHTAHVARELGIPVVVGVGNATLLLRTGSRVTVDAARGWVLPHGAGS